MKINYLECTYSLLAMSLTVNLFLIGWIMFMSPPEHNHDHRAHAHVLKLPKPQHGGIIIKLGYDAKFWAEVVKGPDQIETYLTDQAGKNIHHLITEIDLQQTENGTGASYTFFKYADFFILETIEVREDAELRVCVEGKQYYGSL